MKNLPLDYQNCPISKISKVLQGKWAMVIIYVLSEGTLRFSEIHHKLSHITEANLTKDLRMLESYGIIHREVYPVVPPKVEYSLTDMGKDFLPILDSINKWAEKYTAE
ncbi:helix-turn-helix domain-containing protein [uncultured Clostridium sp.]|uniref:winged helix-turn-helix transcriptional regulator n=1 Tax=uncultured Clostridium sp. TaxID=59620 RepID=UPI0025F42100|nr:helix-turn-helix domain-containing protein [uncultured Clostridium sp.]